MDVLEASHVDRLEQAQVQRGCTTGPCRENSHEIDPDLGLRRLNRRRLPLADHAVVAQLRHELLLLGRALVTEQTLERHGRVVESQEHRHDSSVVQVYYLCQDPEAL